MKFTPLSIKLQEFSRKFRGYDTHEVKAFLTTLADEFDKIYTENEKMKKEFESAKQKITEYSQIEKSLQEVLLKAQEQTKRALDSSKSQADIVLKEAEEKARNIIENSYTRVNQYEEDLYKLKSDKALLISKIRTIIETQARILNIDLSNPNADYTVKTEIKSSGFTNSTTIKPEIPSVIVKDVVEQPVNIIEENKTDIITQIPDSKTIIIPEPINKIEEIKPEQQPEKPIEPVISQPIPKNLIEAESPSTQVQEIIKPEIKAEAINIQKTEPSATDESFFDIFNNANTELKKQKVDNTPKKVNPIFDKIDKIIKESENVKSNQTKITIIKGDETPEPKEKSMLIDDNTNINIISSETNEEFLNFNISQDNKIK